MVALAGCAKPEPVLYPNAHLNAVGQETAEWDIENCEELAESYGASDGDDKTAQVAKNTAGGGAIGGAAGAAGGAVVGSAGRGAAVGAASGAAAGFMRALLREPEPSPAYRQFVSRCLGERGYEVVGWN
jgi:hypothetical protein